METSEYNPFETPEEVQAQEAQMAEYEALGEQMEADENQLLAGKFESAEDLERAYMELQAAFSGRKPAEASEEVAEEVEETEAEEEEEYNETEALFKEIEEFGQLTQETAEKIGEAAAVAIEQLYSQQQQQQSTQLSTQEVDQLQSVVGGAETYQAMVQWASDNLQPGEVEAYDSVMNSGDVNAIYWAMKGLYSNFQDAVGYDGQLVQGKAPSSVTDVFRSQAEVVRAMQDPRYDKDPAYRMDITNKLERSPDLEF